MKMPPATVSPLPLDTLGAGSPSIAIQISRLTVPSFLHFSAATMTCGLQNWLNASSDPSREAPLATLYSTDSIGEDLTN